MPYTHVNTDLLFSLKVCVLAALVLLLLFSGCGGSIDSDATESNNVGVVQPPDSSPENPTPEPTDVKPFPSGIYESAAAIRLPETDIVASTPRSAGQVGVLVKVDWNLCGEDLACLFNTIQLNLDSAASLGLLVGLAVSDGNNLPQSIKDGCTLFEFEFRGAPASMCLPWDQQYLEAKVALITELGQRFDQHPALAYVYFTGACSTNGLEGHCRIDQQTFTSVGYTPDTLSAAYLSIMNAYVEHFAATPIVFEAHAIFDQTHLWEAVWAEVASYDKVGVAAWWCAERLSLNGRETATIWPLIQTIASETFAICQTVASFSGEPFRFSDSTLNLDYGEQTDWHESDAQAAFQDTFDWLQGVTVHAGQAQPIVAFTTVEMWSQDLKNQAFASHLANF
ncbi:hypothetical protein [uncultured Paraglaciecola sp.]|uniref:hypothetical protein n=1 Tax=uncultured Paraglaciecola sp. TaxID=1765024 RepID=UPI0030DBAF95|tara:strand:+ start:10116 stop:11300 length:1185 start_codon:yes stop_codon:yes gene_type:complete